MARVSCAPNLQRSRSQYACALVFCQIRGGDPDFVRLSFTSEASLRCGLLFLGSASDDHVVIVLRTIKTLYPIHLRLISLFTIDAVLMLCEQVIVFILDEREQRRGETNA
jgi:hypothetical protein